MRLINCSTFQLQEFFDSNIPEYAILSHTWSDDEVSFADFTLNQAAATTKEGYRKIIFTCQQALQDGLNYAWVDTCCIDKTSSAELSEAINSMFNWYKCSAMCYAYLSDVSEAHMATEFPASRWHSRGWTLQELLAPEDLIFYDRNWKTLGTKLEHVDWISKITAIDSSALYNKGFFYTHDPLLSTGPLSNHRGLSTFCVAKRMSWASRRETTRAEDTAYCLLGIFGINIPLLYGEGQRAFIRLQEEIMRKSDDDSVLAWGLDRNLCHPLGLVPKIEQRTMEDPGNFSPILACSPKDFEYCGDLEHVNGSSAAFTMTNQGLQIELLLLPLPPLLSGPRGYNEPLGWIGLLHCSPNSNSELLGIVLRRAEKDPTSSKRMERVNVGMLWKNLSCTTVVGPRACTLSTLEKVTILQNNDSPIVRGLYQSYLHVIVNESQALQNMGYQVIGGTGQTRSETTWDQERKILMTEDHGIYGGRDLLRLHFRRRDNGPSDFTLFMSSAKDRKRPHVRRGGSFSTKKELEIHHYVFEGSQEVDEEEIISDMDGNPCRIVVKMHEKTVRRWRVVEVRVDAVRLVAGVS